MSETIEVDGLVVGPCMARHWLEELDRLRRVEKAARALLAVDDQYASAVAQIMNGEYGRAESAAKDALRAALEGREG